MFNRKIKKKLQNNSDNLSQNTSEAERFYGMLYRNNLKNREFDKEASQNFHLEDKTIVRATGASEDENFEKKPMPSKTDSSGCFGIIGKKMPKLWKVSFIASIMVLNPISCSAFITMNESTNNENSEQNTSKITLLSEQTKPYKVNSPFDEFCRNFNFHVDFLYWKADEDGLEFGTKMVASPLIGAASNTNIKLLDLDFQWDPGFRLGAAYNFKTLDDWTLQLNWTHIHNHAHGSSSAQGIESQVGDVNTIISPWVNLLFELRTGASHASAHWHLKYDTLDLDLGKSVFLSKRFLLNPFFGIRGAWIDQDYKANYESVFILAENAPTFSRTVTFKGRNDFNAFGLRVGTELFCKLGRNWHLFSQLTANLLYGKFRVHMKNPNDQGLGEGSIPPMPLNFKASENFWRVRTCFEESIGLGWQIFFRNNLSRLRFRAAYEISQWLNQNQLFYTFYFRGQDTISSVPIRSQGDLSFHGIRIGMQLDF